MKLQLVDLDGTVIQENIVELSDEDTLLIEFDDTLQLNIVHKLYEGILKALNENSKVIAYPKGLNFKILKRQ